MTRPYGLSGTNHVYDWIERTPDSERVDELLAWTKGVCRLPTEFVHRVIERPGTKRRIYVVDLPKARTRIAYIVAEVPARCVHILSISDDEFGRD